MWWLGNNDVITSGIVIPMDIITVLSVTTWRPVLRRLRQWMMCRQLPMLYWHLYKSKYHMVSHDLTSCILEEISRFSSVTVQKVLCQYSNYCITQLLLCWVDLTDCKRSLLKMFVMLCIEKFFGVSSYVTCTCIIWIVLHTCLSNVLTIDMQSVDT